MDETTVEALVAAGDLLIRLHAILAGLTVDRARMRANLDLTAGLISAEAVMLRLAQDIGRQSAHDIVLELAAQATARQTSLEEALLHDLRVNGHITGPEVKNVLDPLHHLGLCAHIAHSAAQRAAAIVDDDRNGRE